MSGYAYVVGKNDTLYFCSLDGKYEYLIGKVSINDETSEDEDSITLVPNIGNVKLNFNKKKFITAIEKAVVIDRLFGESINYKVTNSFSKTVLTNGLFTMPCPYVDHYNIFPSVQELIDTLKHHHNANLFAIIPSENDQYKVFIFEKV